MTTEESVLVDALPYFDLGYDEPGVREAAMQLVQEETRRFRPTRNYLEHLPNPDYHAFETEVLKNEMERLQARLPMDTFSMKRYELPPPTAGKMTDLMAWAESVNNSKAQLEHQALRIANLELMERYGAPMWKLHNEALVNMLSGAQKQLQIERKKTQDCNWQRKVAQTAAGEQLKALEERWVSLVSKNFQIETLCAQMAQQVSAAERAQTDAS